MSEMHEGCVVIDDSNYSQFVQKKSGFVERDWVANPWGSVPCAPPQQKAYPRHEWKERILDQIKQKSRCSDHCTQKKVKFKNQSATLFCASNATIGAMIIARIMQGQPYVELSPASVACKVTGFKNRGHWPRQVVEFSSQHGVVPTEFWPDNEINKKYDTPANNKRRELFRAIEWDELPRFSFPHLISAGIDGKPTSAVFMWMQHVVLVCEGVILDGADRFAIRFRQSYGGQWGDHGYGIISEEKAKPDEAFCPVVMTAD